MNILIFNMSQLREYNIQNGEKAEFTYTSDRRDFKGIQTNEAATRYIMDLLAEKGEKLDKIIYLATKEVKNENGENYVKEIRFDSENKKITTPTKLNTEEFYRERLGLDEKIITAIYNFHKTDGENENGSAEAELKEKTSAEIMSELIKEIDTLYDEDKDLNIYVDTTGGLRNDTNTLQMFVKFLSYKGIKIKLAIYSDFFKKRIERVNFYDLMEVLDGVNQFVTSGQADILGSVLGKEDNKGITDVLDSMKQFANKMRLCSLDGIDTVLEEIEKNIDKLQEEDCENELQLIFYELIPLIREKFTYVKDGKEVKDSIIRITKWCIENNMLQQAITLYVEEIPKYILKKLVKYNGKADGKTEAEILYEKVMNKDTIISNELKSIEAEYRLNEKFKFNKKWVEPMGFLDDKIKECKVDKVISILIKLREYVDKTKDKKNVDISFFNKYSIEEKKKFSDVLKQIGFNYKKVLGESKENRDREMVYSNKIYLIKNINQSHIELNSNVKMDEVKKILTDYLYIKIIRNQINHANGSSFKEDVEEYFKEYRKKCKFDRLELELPKLDPTDLQIYMQKALDRLIVEV